ncbi:MAG TPA: DUF2865 domain-containing protein [Beijerinckiaceae bacterium]|jgi:hypothetical protein
MIPRSILRLMTVAAALLGTAGAALAQSACQRYRAELASLGRGGASDGYAAAAQQARGEIARLSSYYQSIGCERSGFLFFGSAPPPECGAIAARIRSMQSTVAELAGRAQPSEGGEARRAELQAIIRSVCREEDARREAERRAARLARGEDADMPRRLGGGRVVCVRACDGFFFPLESRPARGSEDRLCQALCPGAEAAAYRMPADGEIGEAVSSRGRPYVRLANAFKFQKAFDPSCACKKDGESWAQVLQKAEAMIAHGRGDLVVTAAKAEELSRPKLARTAKAKGKGKPGEAYASGKTDPKTDPKTVDPKVAQAAKEAVEARAADAPLEGEAADSAATVAATAPAVDVDVTGSTGKAPAPKAVRIVGPRITPAPRAATP